jgi:hypothetical protein
MRRAMGQNGSLPALPGYVTEAQCSAQLEESKRKLLLWVGVGAAAGAAVSALLSVAIMSATGR